TAGADHSEELIDRLVAVAVMKRNDKIMDVTMINIFYQTFLEVIFEFSRLTSVRSECRRRDSMYTAFNEFIYDDIN
ncbi:hypothetical protein AB4589_24455, partial [Vibrio sp. 10N.222.49.A3]|uniref:hypothetical protein n=1 Tax=Vibrio sp. 10N.222.49.A3 TaxID=3229611 RepID=UPI0035524C42